jgi:hypothetical protein
MKLKQIVLLLIFVLELTQSSVLFARDEAANAIVDDSIRDMSIVLGAGAAGAILGLSTLSFVDEPSAHAKNIAVGGAIGIVFGVAVVIFYQASKTNVYQAQSTLPLSAEQFASVSKKEFKEYKLSDSQKMKPNQSDALRILLPF